MNRQALTHSLRVTIRFAVGHTQDTPVDVDVAVPAGARLADVLPEVCDVAGISPPVSPWEARTPAGSLIPTATPLAWSHVRPGSIITIRDLSRDTEPLVTSDTEALTQVRRARGGTGYAAVACATGFFMIILLLTAHPVGLTVATVACLALGAGMRLTWKEAIHPTIIATVSIGTSILAFLAGIQWTYWFAGEPGSDSLITPLGLVTAGGSLLLVTAITHSTLRPPRTVTVTLLTVGVGTCAWAGLAGGATTVGLAPTITGNTPPPFITPSITAAAPLSALIALTVVIYGPLVALRIAGITITTVPSAGADLATTDVSAQVYTGATSRARRATGVFDGIVTGACLLGGGASLVTALGTHPAHFRLLFATVLVACLAMQATRHASAVGAWAVWLWSMSTAISAACAVFIHPGATQPSPATIGIAVALATVFVASGLWAPRVANMPPTTIAALEKLESACVIIALPLGLHLAGVFAAIRGLG